MSKGFHFPWDEDLDRIIEREERTEIGLLLWITRTLHSLGHHIDGMEARITMALADDLAAAAAATGQAATDAANRVIATINDNNTQLAALQAHGAEDDALIATLEAQIASGTVTPEAAQAVLDAFTAIKDTVDGIDATPIPTV